MSKPKLYIDQGHNFSHFNTGVVGNGMREQDITFHVGYRLKQLLQDDFEVILSRETLETNLGHNNTSSINHRWQEANKLGVDYFMSLHTNGATNNTANGAETFYFRHGSQRSERSQAFAEVINNIYVRETGLRDRGVRPDTKTHIGSIGVLRHTNMPAILVELGFISALPHMVDIALLRDHERMAQALAKGVYAYFALERSQQKNATPIEDASSFEPEERATVTFALLGNTVEIDGYIENGVTMVRARQLLEEKGLQVGWNGDTQTVIVKHATDTPPNGFSEEDIHFLEQTAHFEAMGESSECMQAVVHVVLNRLREPHRPNTIKEVVLERTYDNNGNIESVQFTPTLNPNFGIANVSHKVRQAVQTAINSESNVGNATFFANENKLKANAFHFRAEKDGRLQRVATIGAHTFWALTRP